MKPALLLHSSLGLHIVIVILLIFVRSLFPKCRFYVLGKPEGKRPLGRPRGRWVDNIKIDLREIGWDGVDWIDLAQDRDQWRALVNTVRNLRVP
jgi:hypothetical protein